MPDVVIVGSGVAGLSAGIAAASCGLEARILERGDEPPERPGETLHPGLEPLFSKLGVKDEAERAATHRPGGIQVRRGDHVESHDFGGPTEAPWLGYHIPRRELHDVLLRRALELGVDLRFGSAARAVQETSTGDLTIETGNASHSCRWLLDGTGLSNWLARIDRTSYRDASPQLTVSYGYLDAESTAGPPPWPSLTFMPWGWVWNAALGDGRLAWVKLFYSRQAMRQHRQQPCRSTDATWKVSAQPANSRMFRIGDSALRFDPSSGKGVLRAMMTAIMAVHLIRYVTDGRIGGQTAAMTYSRWISDWFRSDAKELTRLLCEQRQET